MNASNCALATILGLSAFLALSGDTKADEPLELNLVETTRVWGQSPHCAFTDLVRWRDGWYCGFREGEGHAGDRGWLRILHSQDAKNWVSVAKIDDDEFDLRDAALSVTPDDRLLVVAGSQHTVDGERSTGTFAALSDDGETFSEPVRIFPQGRWMWRVTWHNGTGYGVSYSAYADYPTTQLVTTKDGLEYDIAMNEMLSSGWPTEARIRFAKDGTAYCLQRVDRDKTTSLLGKAVSPYTEWTWTDLGQRVGGPNFVELPNGRWVGCGRLTVDGTSRTVVFELDLDAGKIQPLVQLPSGGDSSYPGMVVYDGELYISYYSSHEGSTSIYLARLELDAPE
ncbi:sialidase family protein [Aeoliella sp.]|uniref:sialidase family protein n=1 Tax=Aeoliella sp. TaxID=2795800 RepID=UPI003CCC1E8F